MKTIVISFFLLTSLHARIQALPSAEIWSRGNEYFPVETEKKTHHLISTKCKSLTCQAYLALNDHHKKVLTKSELAGGKNPGAVICKKYFKATVIILKDTKQNENAFCKFPDGSLVSASALY